MKKGIELGRQLVFTDAQHGVNVVSILKIWSSDTPFAQDLGYDLKDPKTLSLHHRERLGMVREALKKQRFDVLSGVFGFR